MYLSNLIILLFLNFTLHSERPQSAIQEFQGKAFYYSKTKMELGAWGARMSEAEKKTN